MGMFSDHDLDPEIYSERDLKNKIKSAQREFGNNPSNFIVYTIDRPMKSVRVALYAGTVEVDLEVFEYDGKSFMLGSRTLNYDCFIKTEYYDKILIVKAPAPQILSVNIEGKTIPLENAKLTKGPQS